MKDKQLILEQELIRLQKELIAKQATINSQKEYVKELEENQEALYAELFEFDSMSVWQFFKHKIIRG